MPAESVKGDEGLFALCAALTPPATPTATFRLPSATNRVEVVDVEWDGEATTEIVVRRCGPRLAVVEPGAFDIHYSVISLLHGSDVAVARPLLLDSTGEHSDVPAIVTTRLPGRVELAPQDVLGWARQLARALARLHDAVSCDRVPAGVPALEAQPPGARAERPLDELSRTMPEAATVHRLLEGWDPHEPAGEYVLLHRDFHPGNCLFDGTTLSGVVDWDHARRGPRGFDVAHCRVDVALLFGLEAADEFLDAYEDATGQPVPESAWWDLHRGLAAMHDFTMWLPALRAAGARDLGVPAARRRLRAFAQAAIERARGQSKGAA